MKKYIGITIGPIFKTMSLTSSPVALWASSYIFSLLSRTICENLVKDGVDKNNIVTPYYDEDEPLLAENNGTGLFPDHIIFNAENYDASRMQEIIENSVVFVAEQFNLDIDYLKKYVMVAGAEFEADNPILGCGKILDSLELATPFIAEETTNHILSLFSGDEYSKNNSLKGIPVISLFEKFQLKKTEKSFKSLEDIVGTGNGYKKYKYYAIVRSDGDSMSRIISNLQSDEDIRKFSFTCLEYCSKIAKSVEDFNGVTVYSAGDDLLAILPCESKDGKSLFEFVEKANKIFGESFDKYNQPTSLSFGITVAYYKFPLYEALDDSYDLLETAKSNGKNRLAIRLQKHSGQAETLVIPNGKTEKIIDILETVKKNKEQDNNGENENDKIFLSALHKVAMFEKLFNGTENEDEIYALFKNTFDGNEHTDNVFLHQKLPEFFVGLSKDNSVKAVNEDGIAEGNPALALCYVLRFLKFFFEKDGDGK